MKALNLARRYANALFLTAKENNEEEVVYNELKVFADAFNETEITEFFANPVNSLSSQVAVIKKLTDGLKMSETLKNFIHLLSEKNRVQLVAEIIESYQNLIDEKNGVTRGEVISSHMLTPQEREKIEDIVSKKTKKRVILTYKEDANLLGGLIAKVGGYTFDDTLTMHLGRLNEDLRRRVH